jgi:8-amino-7-oxononanoate synthase
MGFFEDTIDDLKERGLLRSLKSVGSPQGPEIVLNGRKVLNFCSNDYLGLAGDPRLAEASADAARRYGAGSGAARLIAGNNVLNEELETALAAFKGSPAALLFNSGYHANIGAIPALAGEGDVIFSDEFNHASLIDGCRLSKADTRVYRHNDLGHLEGLLSRGAVSAPARNLIVTESVFSMEGDVCPLNDLLALAQKYGAFVYLDEAHAVGVLGDTGQGLAPKSFPENLICMGTMGKAFGSYGAFVAGSASLKAYLINKARSFIFTTSLPPSVTAASLEALKIVAAEPERQKKLWENIRRLGDHPSPIFSLPIGGAEKTMEISKNLLDLGLFVQGIRPPTVPEGTSRLRLTLSAAHTEAHIAALREGLKSVI